MPEGDTIFRSARTLQHALAGKTVTRFETAFAKLAQADDDRSIAGLTVERVTARGKWLLMHFSGDLILLTHMRMKGSWHIYRVGERWRSPRKDMRIAIETNDWVAVGFNVPVAEFHSAASLRRHTTLPALGPDLLCEDFDQAEALTRIRKHPAEEIGIVLLNQRVMAGIGNVYKSEICFACGVHPFQHVETLAQQKLEEIAYTAQKFLRVNASDTADGRITTHTGLRLTTRSSDPSARLWVYGRAGEPCRRCGTVVITRKQGKSSRTTFWCPNCQPLRA